MRVEITTSIHKGLFKRNRNLVLEAIKSFEGKDVVITLEKPKKKRSNLQNAYLWGVLYPITQQAFKNEWGEVWTVENIHEFYKMQFQIIEKVNEDTGEVIKLPKSTTENTTIQQEQYHSNIRGFLKEWFNVTAPLPNEDLRIEI